MDWKYVAEVVVPIINCVVIVLTAIFGLYKYFRSKNKDYYEKMLTKVYAPLYQFLVRQGIVFKYIEKSKNLKDTLLTDVYLITEETNNGNKQTNRVEIADLKHENFIDVRKEANIAIAPSKLLLLINEYESMISIRDAYRKIKKVFVVDEAFESERTRIENDLIEEITLGYLKYIMLYKYNFLQRAFYWKKEKENIFWTKSI